MSINPGTLWCMECGYKRGTSSGQTRQVCPRGHGTLTPARLLDMETFAEVVRSRINPDAQAALLAEAAKALAGLVGAGLDTLVAGVPVGHLDTATGAGYLTLARLRAGTPETVVRDFVVNGAPVSVPVQGWRAVEDVITDVVKAAGMISVLPSRWMVRNDEGEDYNRKALMRDVDCRLWLTLDVFKSEGTPASPWIEEVRKGLQAVIEADDVGKGTTMEYPFAVAFQKAARLCSALLASLPRESPWISVKERPRVVCLCGSTRFTGHMLVKQWELTKQGFIVLSWCALPEGYFDGDGAHGAERDGIKEEMDELHKRKIDLADEVFVINLDGYIGESTRSEIDYAEAHGKPVRYLASLPPAPKDTQVHPERD